MPEKKKPGGWAGTPGGDGTSFVPANITHAGDGCQGNSNAAIQDLKNSLPDIPSCCPDLKKESATSECGSCPRCGGDDRFVFKTDSEKAWCRQCHEKPMDKIDFHAWLGGQSTSDYLKEHLPKNDSPPLRDPPPDPANNEIHMQWNQILTHTNEKPVLDLFRRRGLSDEVARQIFAAGLARFKSHARQVSVAVPYFTLDGDVIAIQCLTVDGKPYSFTVENGKPANKVMVKGSAPGKDGFFICGADVNTAGEIILAESVINTLTAVECFPDACGIALGASGWTDKVKALKPYAERAEKVVVLVDNDAPSEKMLRAIWEILGNKVYSIKWDATDPAGHDVNDALQAGQRDRVIDLIQNAEPVWYKADDVPGSDAENTTPKFKLVKLSEIKDKKPDYLVYGLMEIDSTVSIFSPPSDGKTFLAIDFGMSIATGKDFHGRFAKQGPVIFIIGEGQNGFKRRCTAWAIRHQVDLDAAPIFISTMPTGLCDSEQVDFVIDAVKAVADEYGNPAMIVFDTVARNFGPGDENSTKDMTAFISGADKIRSAFKCCILLVHHSGHADRSRGRGSMALKGALDVEYRLEKDETGVVRVTVAKPPKDFESPPPMAFRLNTVELPYTDDQGNAVTSAILDDTEYQPPPINGKKGRGKWQTVSVEILKALYKKQRINLESKGYDPDQARVLLEDWRTACMGKGMTRQTWKRIKDNLKWNPDIAQDGSYVRLISDVT
jgi:hypothetical protein